MSVFPFVVSYYIISVTSCFVGQGILVYLSVVAFLMPKSDRCFLFTHHSAIWIVYRFGLLSYIRMAWLSKELSLLLPLQDLLLSCNLIFLATVIDLRSSHPIAGLWLISLSQSVFRISFVLSAIFNTPSSLQVPL